MPQTTNSINLLSLVMPAYKQEKTIVHDVINIDRVLSELPYPYEIIVVVDGYLDKTYELVKKIENKKVRVFGYEDNKGKGYAVKYGMSRAKGDVVGFLDAGLDINATGIAILLDTMVWNNADIVIGSKLHPQSKIRYPLTRKILSWGYRSLTHALFGFNVKDTQVGLKFFKKRVAQDVFSRIVVKAFAFDVEVLAVAEAQGYSKIYEAPIELDFNGASSITSGSFWRIIFHMLWDTFAVFYRLKIINNYKKSKI